MMRRKLVAALAVTAFVVAACGDDDDDSGDASDTTGDAGETGTTGSDAGGDATATTAGGDTGDGSEVALRWRTRPDNDAEIEVYQSVSDSIDEAETGFSLTYEPGGTETAGYQDQLVTEIGSGTAPDVFWIPGTDIARFQQEGLILDLAPLAAAEDFSTEEFYPEPMYHLTYDPEAGAPGDKLWGLPRDVSTFAIYLNLDLIGEAGAEDPRVLAAEGEWDWAAFAEVAEKVTALGDPYKGFAMNGWWANYGAFINAAGGGFFTDDRTACALDTDESVAGITQAKAIYDAGWAVPYGEDGEAPWKAGTVGMFINGRWATPGARADADFNWDVVELPTGPSGSQGNWLFWGAYVVNAETEHPEEAWALAKALTTAETQATISELGANIPSRKSQEAIDAFLTYTPPDNAQAYITALEDEPTAEGPLWTGDWPKYDEIMNGAVTAVLTGERTVEDYQANICAETAPAFEG